ncbi:hypothetical protein C5B42_01890 [Candidatus Cerribacteria bacterium 'Amazon FNV 2010 28 9']|uniref:Uncharacterized protein n=1 Tax=Candidatus Cerribacteria bacterium 'Amazon FNV 2010 28 9' TaxID=2081795 RepID=A0A317JPH0_9BACT|nr:MAG: hypothetical protein C5B42_01890 [Candidatus Cerribacteria bacterium 'Amazon FNV 2010 28 9']
MLLADSSLSTKDLFTNVNNAIFGTGGKALSDKNAVPPDQVTPRGIITSLMPYLFTAAGLILFVMIVWGGFEMLTGATNPKQQEAGRQRITTALVGFLIIFCAYWLARIVELILGVSIVG